MRVSPSETEMDGIAGRFRKSMDLGCQPAARAPNSLIALFFLSTRSVLVSAHDSAVKAGSVEVSMSRKFLKHLLPNPGLAPPGKAFVDAIPCSEARG